MMHMHVCQVITRARELWKEEARKSALLDRMGFQAGDFFNHGEQLQPETCPCWQCSVLAFRGSASSG